MDDDFAESRGEADEEKDDPVLLIQQFLAENGYKDTLQSFENESRVSYNEGTFKFGGRLLTILDEYAALKAALKFGALSLDNDSKEQFLTEGDGVYAKDHFRSFDDLHKANILAVRFSNDPDATLLATASSDKTLKITDYTTGEVKNVITVHTSPILTLDFHPKNHNILLSGGMDSVHCILDISKPGDASVVQQFKQHNKYVVKAKWHPEGDMFATASYDKTVCIYKREGDSFNLVKTLNFATNVEAISFSLDGSQLLIAAREDNNIYSINLDTFERTKYNMNANGDNHVSFSAMDITPTPDGKHYLVSTDKDRLILFKYGSSNHVRSYYGATNDMYSQPRHSISPSGQYVYSTSQDNIIYVWDIALQKVVGTFKGHTSVVRDIHYHPTKKLLASCSFDKKVVLWN